MKKNETNVLVVTIALFLATFMSAVEGTIVSTAMPTIVGDLKGVSIMNWVFSIFLLGNAISAPIAGKLADRVGRKVVFVSGILLFLAASMLAGLSSSMVILIIWRFVQGLGAGVILPVSYTIIADMYPIDKRANVIGFNGAAWGIASVLAPLLGGFLVDSLSWRWVFFINVPLGIITLILVTVYFREPKRTAKDSFDIVGVLLLSLELFFVMFLLQLFGESKLPVLWVTACSAVVITAAIALFIWEPKASDPVIPLKMFKNSIFVSQNLIAALVAGFVFGFDVYLPDWMQGIMGLPATMAGFASTPCSILWMLGSFISGRMIVHYLPGQIMKISLTIVLLGAIVLSFFPISTPFWVFFIFSGFLGIGFGMTMTTSPVAVQNSVSKKHIGTASSFNTLSQTLGQTIMISIFGIVFNQSLNHGISGHPSVSLKMMNQLINPQTAHFIPKAVLPIAHQILYGAIHNVFLGTIVLAGLAIIVNLWGLWAQKKN